MPRTEPFEKYLKEYEEWFEKHRYAYLSEVEAVRQFIPERKTGIEIGIGTGRFSLPLGIKEGVEPAMTMREFSGKLWIKVHDGIAAFYSVDEVANYLKKTGFAAIETIQTVFGYRNRLMKFNCSNPVMGKDD